MVDYWTRAFKDCCGAPGVWIPLSFPLPQTAHEARIRFYAWATLADKRDGRVERHAAFANEICYYNCCGARDTLLTMDKNIETAAQSRVDVFNCILEMWLEVLALEV